MKRRRRVRPQVEAKLTCYLSKGNFRLKAENFELQKSAGKRGRRARRGIPWLTLFLRSPIKLKKCIQRRIL